MVMKTTNAVLVNMCNNPAVLLAKQPKKMNKRISMLVTRILWAILVRYVGIFRVRYARIDIAPDLVWCKRMRYKCAHSHFIISKCIFHTRASASFNFASFTSVIHAYARIRIHNVFVYISHWAAWVNTQNKPHFEGDYRNWWLTRALIDAIQLSASRSNIIAYLCSIGTWSY